MTADPLEQQADALALRLIYDSDMDAYQREILGALRRVRQETLADLAQNAAVPLAVCYYEPGGQLVETMARAILFKEKGTP